jgi:hypothetical protein
MGTPVLGIARASAPECQGTAQPALAHRKGRSDRAGQGHSRSTTARAVPKGKGLAGAPLASLLRPAGWLPRSGHRQRRAATRLRADRARATARTPAYSKGLATASSCPPSPPTTRAAQTTPQPLRATPGARIPRDGRLVAPRASAIRKRVRNNPCGQAPDTVASAGDCRRESKASLAGTISCSEDSVARTHRGKSGRDAFEDRLFLTDGSEPVKAAGLHAPHQLQLPRPRYGPDRTRVATNSPRTASPVTRATASRP